MCVSKTNLKYRINCSLFFWSAVSEIWSQYKGRHQRAEAGCPAPATKEPISS